MSQPGLLHYIGNKERLLSLLVTDSYDQQGTPADFAKSGLPGSDSDGMLFRISAVSGPLQCATPQSAAAVHGFGN